MSKSLKDKIVISVLSFLVLVSMTFVAILSVKSFDQYDDYAFCHTIEMSENIEEEIGIDQNIIYYIRLNGEIRNCTEKDYDAATMTVSVLGTNNKTGEKAKVEVSVPVMGLKKDSWVPVSNESLKVWSDKGFVPESVEKVEIMTPSGEEFKVVKIENKDGNIVWFTLSLVSLVGFGIMLAKKVYDLSQDKKS